MNRRNALIALSGAVTTTLLFAAPRRQALGQTTAIGHQIDAADYRRMTLMAGSFALQTSQLAVVQAVDPRVKEFAQFEINEQVAIAQVLTNTSDANPAPASIDQAHMQMLQALRTSQGRTFDAAYVQGQVTGHQQLLAIQQSFLTPPVLHRDLEHIAVLARATITQHLAMLHDLQLSMPA